MQDQLQGQMLAGFEGELPVFRRIVFSSSLTNACFFHMFRFGMFVWKHVSNEKTHGCLGFIGPI